MSLGKRVAILTGGGDVPGLNVCLKSLVYRIIDVGFEPVGVRKGWDGLINYDYHDPTTYGQHFIELTKNMVRPIDRSPGSFLHSSRVDPSAVPSKKLPKFLRKEGADVQDVTSHIIEVVQRLGIKALITVGDDDMLIYAAHLSQQGVPIIAIPKTVHNNIHGTDYTIGFSTGLARGVAFIHELRALAGSREQVIVVETFGVSSGLSSLMTAFLAGADRAIIPEVPFDPEKLTRLAMRDRDITPSNYAVVTVSDGAYIDPEIVSKYEEQLAHYGDHRLVHSGRIVAELMAQISGEEVFLQPLTYLLRTGVPDGQDLLGATNFAILAARLLKEGKFGRMTAYQQRYNLTDVDLQVVTQGVNRVDVAEMYDVDQYRPKVNLIWAAQES